MSIRQGVDKEIKLLRGFRTNQAGGGGKGKTVYYQFSRVGSTTNLSIKKIVNGVANETIITMSAQTTSIYADENISVRAYNMSTETCRITAIKDLSFNGTYYPFGSEINFDWRVYQSVVIGEYRVYLYKDGTQSVAWDNSGYTCFDTYTNDGGFTLSDNFMEVPTVSAFHSRFVVTDKTIDLSDYKTLKVLYNGSSTISVDISSISTVAYIGICFTNYQGTNSYVNVIVGTQKNMMGTHDYTRQQINATDTIKFNRVWLEK